MRSATRVDFRKPALTDDARGRARLERIRNIAREHQCAKIDGVFVDASTASAIIRVHDGLSDANAAKLRALPLATMSKIVWSVLS